MSSGPILLIHFPKKELKIRRKVPETSDMAVLVKLFLKTLNFMKSHYHMVHMQYIAFKPVREEASDADSTAVIVRKTYSGKR